MDIVEARRVLRLDHASGRLFWKVDVGTSALAGRQAGCLDGSNGYRKLRYKGRVYQEHRVVWLLAYGEWPLRLLDHINRDRSDNRLCNLRLATVTENNRNRPRQVSNKSGVIGVYWSAEHRKWKAQITVDGRRIFLGLHGEKKKAADARLAAEIKYFGEFRPSSAAA